MCRSVGIALSMLCLCKTPTSFAQVGTAELSARGLVLARIVAAEDGQADLESNLFVPENSDAASRRTQILDFFSPHVFTYQVRVGDGEDDVAPDAPIGLWTAVATSGDGELTLGDTISVPENRQKLTRKEQALRIPRQSTNDRELAPDTRLEPWREELRGIAQGNIKPQIYGVLQTRDECIASLLDLDPDSMVCLQDGQIRVAYFAFFMFNDADPQGPFGLLSGAKRWDHIGDWVTLADLTVNVRLQHDAAGEAAATEIDLSHSEVAEAWFSMHGAAFVVPEHVVWTTLTAAASAPGRFTLVETKGSKSERTSLRPLVWLEEGSHEPLWFAGGRGLSEIPDDRDIQFFESNNTSTLENIKDWGLASWEDMVREHRGGVHLADWEVIDVSLPTDPNAPDWRPDSAQFFRLFAGRYGPQNNSPRGPSKESKHWSRTGYADPQPWTRDRGEEPGFWEHIQIPVVVVAGLASLALIGTIAFLAGPAAFLFFLWAVATGLLFGSALLSDWIGSLGDEGEGQSALESALEPLDPATGDAKPDWVVGVNANGFTVKKRGGDWEDFAQFPLITCHPGDAALDQLALAVSLPNVLKAGLALQEGKPAAVLCVLDEAAFAEGQQEGQKGVVWSVTPPSVLARASGVDGECKTAPPPCDPQVLPAVSERAPGVVGWCEESGLYWHDGTDSAEPGWQLIVSLRNLPTAQAMRWPPKQASFGEEPRLGEAVRLVAVWLEEERERLWSGDVVVGVERGAERAWSAWRTEDGQWLLPHWDSDAWYHFGDPFFEPPLGGDRAREQVPREAVRDVRGDLFRVRPGPAAAEPEIVAACWYDIGQDREPRYRDAEDRVWRSTTTGARR